MDRELNNYIYDTMIWIRYRSISIWNISYKLSSSINKIQVVLYTVLKIEFTKHSNYL